MQFDFFFQPGKENKNCLRHLTLFKGCGIKKMIGNNGYVYPEEVTTARRHDS